MSAFLFPTEILTFQDPSYEPLHHYARALAAVRRAMTPRQKHWGHSSLRVNATGLTTTPIPNGGETFELALDLTAHRLLISASSGTRIETRLRGQPLSQFWSELLANLRALNVRPIVEKPPYPDAPPVYAAGAVETYWRALSQMDLLLKQFQGELRGETSPVQFWSHHFDLAMLWYSGRLVPGADPAEEEKADEQMNFGFSPGDEGIPEPYLYITAYPLPDGLVSSPLPNGAYWHTHGWNGAVMLYKTLAASREPDALLLEFWRTVQRHSAALMRG